MTREADSVTDAGSDGEQRSGAYTARRSGEDGVEPSYHVVETVSEAIGTPIEELRPLFEVLDPDALDKLFDVSTRRNSTREGTITFRYEGCDVSVYTDGRTVVSRRGDER